ncbi:MAG: hypothetical protein ACREDL_16665 [Bradyrhizobium sp.]
MAACLAAPLKAATPLTADQQVLAMLIDSAMFAASKCPGFHIVAGSIRANADGAGVTPDQAMGEEWKTAMALADVYAEEGYKKDPTGWCFRMWKMAGQNLKSPILSKSGN